MISVLVCDDDNDVLKKIKNLIDNYVNLYHTDVFVDLKLSGDFIVNTPKSYDIVFIDIEMPGIGGLRLAEELKKLNKDVLILMVTSHQKYLDDAMSIRVFRYLSKPIDEERFYSNFQKAIDEYYNICRFIVINTKESVFYVKTSDILYMEKRKRGALIVTKNGEYLTNKKIDEWLSEINMPNCFVYSHSSINVNLQNVVNFTKEKVMLRKNKNEVIETYVSQRRYKQFKKAFFSYSGGIN